MTSPESPAPPPNAPVADRCAAIRAAVRRAVVGQNDVIDDLLTLLLAGGHGLLVGVPGLAKTLMVRSLAQATGLSFNRVQFTPDLMPSDITGTDVLQEDRATGRRTAHFIEGPIFSQLLLADEINRTPPKTQAALLEAMQEQQVTVGGRLHRLPTPFFVLATQNPIEQEGTYPLPEAQRDRFMFEIHVGYPSRDEEFDVIQRTTSVPGGSVEPVVTPEELLRMQQDVRRMKVADHVIQYAMDLARATRSEEPEAPQFVREWIRWGAGPRASQHLVLAAKSRAALIGDAVVTSKHVQRVAPCVLQHRLIPTFQAEAENIGPAELIQRLLESVRPAGERPHPTLDRILSNER